MIRAALLVGAVSTVVVALVPQAPLAIRESELHLLLETAEGMVAALLAFLAANRYRSSRVSRDLFVAWAFGVSAAVNLFVLSVPGALFEQRPTGFLLWLAAVLRVAGAGALCAGAVLRPGAPLRPAEAARRVVAASLAVVIVACVAALLLDAGLTNAVDPEIDPIQAGRPLVAGNPAVSVLHLVGAGLYAVAAWAFDRRAAVEPGSLMTWLAAGAILAAFARLSYVMYPSLLSDWVYMGDFLRLGAFACWLTGAAGEIDAYWRSRTEVAVHEERERVARELHDGLAQELAFVRSQTAAFATGGGRVEMLPYVAEAAERALLESRRAIAALSDPSERSLHAGLVRAAREVADRSDVDIRFELVADVPLHRETHEALERIVREAVSNAVRHGEPRRVCVALEPAGRGVRLVVADDGRGVDLATVERGYGLVSMRRRAERIGARFSIRSEPGAGTTVEVVLA